MLYSSGQRETEPDHRLLGVIRGPVIIDLYCFVVVLVSLRQPILWFLETTNWLADARWERSAYLNIAALVIYVPAASISLEILRKTRTISTLLAGFVSWTILTSVFNQIPEAQAHDLLMVIVTVLAFVGLHALVGVDRLLGALFAATLLGIALSFSVLIATTGGISYPHGPWAGVFGNKNHFGLICGLNVSTAVHLILQKNRVWHFWRVVMTLMACALSLWVLIFMTLNASNEAGLLVATAGAGVLIAARRRLHSGVSRGANPVAIRAVLPSYVLTVLAGVIAARELLAALLMKDPSFTGRTRFWSEGLEGALQRPIVGWGWWTAHDNPEFTDLFSPFSGMTSHSFWVQTALGSGFIGFTLALVLVVTGLAALSKAFITDQMTTIPAVGIPLQLLVFFSAEDVRSQYAMGFALLITMLIAAEESSRAQAPPNACPIFDSDVVHGMATGLQADSSTNCSQS
jgi:O-antigen ligase